MTEKTYSKEKILYLSEGVRISRANSHIGLNCILINFSSAHLRVYFDTSFRINDNISWQLGYLVFLAGKNNVYISDFCSKKTRRAVLFIRTTKLYNIMEDSGAAVFIAKVAQAIHGASVSKGSFTDSKKRLVSIRKGQNTTEKR